MAPPRVWRVVGGGGHGGVVIREGRELSSPQAPDRLATGALVAEEELLGGQLRFRRLSGEGPDEGWVRLRLGQAELLVPHSEQRAPQQKPETKPPVQPPPQSRTVPNQAPDPHCPPASAGIPRASPAPPPLPAPAPPPPASAEGRHAARAAELRELLLQVRSEGAERFQRGMQELWRAAEALEPRSLVLARRARPEDLPSPFCAVADRRLLSFEALASDLQDEMRQLTSSPSQSSALKALLRPLDALIDLPGLKPLEAAPLGLPRATAELRLPAAGPALVNLGPNLGRPGLWAPETTWRVLPLVCLPLALYVRNTSHLYATLERLKSRASWGGHVAAGTGGLRAALDADDRKYSFLVFAITAALQCLIVLRRRMGPERFPHALLASSPPLPSFAGSAPGSRNAFPMKDEWPEAQLIFRGIWIGESVDEEQARFQYSFQSFAREVQGMNRVLAFYADVPGAPAQRLAEEHRHALVYVARVEWAKQGCLAMPVQMFDGPNRAEDGEYEVMLPPYVRYELEDELSLTSADIQASEAGERLDALRRRWGLELPQLLLCMLKDMWHDCELALRRLRPRLTLRFVRAVELPPPLAELFDERQGLLYDFRG
uniref:Uncharacterized protein n=1 Tax=Alexandrium monilatum TaxID=311494 RepID=A0A7S4VBE5_9DINO